MAPAAKAGLSKPLCPQFVSNLLYFLLWLLGMVLLTSNKRISKTPVPLSQPCPCYSKCGPCVSNRLPRGADRKPMESGSELSQDVWGTDMHFTV